MMDVFLAVLGGIVFVLLGAGFGYQSAMMRERKAGGGRTASELKTELEDYQQNVSDHFMESAALLQGMTEQYKKIYEHMARGAQDLCETQEDRPELAALRNGLLAAALASSTHEDLVHVGKVLEAQAESRAESRAIEDEQQAALDAPEGQAAGATEAASSGSEETFAEAGGEAENDAFADTSSQAQAQAEALASEDVDGAAVEVAEIEPGCAVDGEVAQAEDADMATSGATEAVAAEASVGIHTEADADSDSERVAAPEPAEEPPAPGWAERYRSA